MSGRLTRLRYALGRFVKVRFYSIAYVPFRSKAIKTYFDTHAVRKVQIGTGSNLLDGWLNTDVYPEIGLLKGFKSIIFLDAAARFPFDDCTVDYVFSEHAIEHLSCNQAVNMLHESYRILRPGGKIRVSTPDLQAVAGLTDQQLNEQQREYSQFLVQHFLSEIDATNAAPAVRAHGALATNIVFYGHGHRFLYDQPTLQAAMEDAGFTDVERRRPGESGDLILRGLEMHGKVIASEEANRFETMALEATRPVTQRVESPARP